MKGMNFDLHVHTNISSCSKLELGDILRYARAFGLDGVCITDHQTMEIRHHLREGIQEDGLCVIFGMEYSTQDGDFLIFGPVEDISPTLSAEEMLALVDKCGGLAIAAHPFRSNRPVREHIIRQGRCLAIESINGRNTALKTSVPSDGIRNTNSHRPAAVMHTHLRNWEGSVPALIFLSGPVLI